MKEELDVIVKPLLKWYEENKRILPWRESKEAYSIWISEIMLQQTRIEAVKSYYARFMKELPNIHALAIIEEEKLLKLWEGLGYYNRARNLQKAAKKIEEDYAGKMPNTYDELIKLPGIGEYTAGAIASIAYNEKVPAVDGNVLRVISRILASSKDVLLPETKKEITNQIKTIMPEEHAGDFNEALMELGELVCLPNGIPECNKCPVNKYCKAYQKNLVDKIPVREKKTKRKKEEKTVFVMINKEGKIAIQKREQKGVLKGMYEFPNVSNLYSKSEIIQYLQNTWKIQIDEPVRFLGEYKHIFTHIEWKIYGYQIKVKGKYNEFLWVSREKLEKEYALPTAFKQLLNFKTKFQF